MGASKRLNFSRTTDHSFQAMFSFAARCVLRNVYIISDDTCGAQKKVLETASTLGISITVGVAYQVEVSKTGIMLIKELKRDISFKMVLVS